MSFARTGRLTLSAWRRRPGSRDGHAYRYPLPQPHGNPDKYVHAHPHPTTNETIIEVHDNGPGIPKKHEFTIWDRFERGPHTYLSKVQGSGLGLAIARQLVAAHNGHTGNDPSERLGGACFWLTIPNTRANHSPKPATNSIHAA